MWSFYRPLALYFKKWNAKWNGDRQINSFLTVMGFLRHELTKPNAFAVIHYSRSLKVTLLHYLRLILLKESTCKFSKWIVIKAILGSVRPVSLWDDKMEGSSSFIRALEPLGCYACIMITVWQSGLQMLKNLIPPDDWRAWTSVYFIHYTAQPVRYCHWSVLLNQGLIRNNVFVHSSDLSVRLKILSSYT